MKPVYFLIILLSYIVTTTCFIGQRFNFIELPCKKTNQYQGQQVIFGYTEITICKHGSLPAKLEDYSKCNISDTEVIDIPTYSCYFIYHKDQRSIEINHFENDNFIVTITPQDYDTPKIYLHIKHSPHEISSVLKELERADLLKYYNIAPMNGIFDTIYKSYEPQMTGLLSEIPVCDKNGKLPDKRYIDIRFGVRIGKEARVLYLDLNYSDANLLFLLCNKYPNGCYYYTYVVSESQQIRIRFAFNDNALVKMYYEGSHLVVEFKGCSVLDKQHLYNKMVLITRYEKPQRRQRLKTNRQVTDYT
jgi:hypothetical protein